MMIGCFLLQAQCSSPGTCCKCWKKGLGSCLKLCGPLLRYGAAAAEQCSVPCSWCMHTTQSASATTSPCSTTASCRTSTHPASPPWTRPTATCTMQPSTLRQTTVGRSSQCHLGQRLVCCNHVPGVNLPGDEHCNALSEDKTGGKLRAGCTKTLTVQDCFAEKGGPLATAEEKKRLEELLASFPTTEAEDEKLLSGSPLPPAARCSHPTYSLDSVRVCENIKKTWDVSSPGKVFPLPNSDVCSQAWYGGHHFLIHKD